MKKVSPEIVIKFGIIGFIMFYGCCTPSTELSKYKNAETIGSEKYSNDFEMVKNESGTLILCYKEDKKKSQPHTSVEYFVYDLNTNEIIFEDMLFDADIEWFDDHNIEIKIIHEIISDDGESGYVLNVLTGEKTNLFK